jgi:hypothetical protein
VQQLHHGRKLICLGYMTWLFYVNAIVTHWHADLSLGSFHKLLLAAINTFHIQFDSDDIVCHIIRDSTPTFA